jgi:hypothetical protein
VAVVNFADNIVRFVVTGDYEGLIPITSLDQLEDLDWVDRE